MNATYLKQNTQVTRTTHTPHEPPHGSNIGGTNRIEKVNVCSRRLPPPRAGNSPRRPVNVKKTIKNAMLVPFAPL